MSLAHLDSQIEGLRAQAADIQKRGARTRDSITKDRTLSDIGKREQLDKAREQFKSNLSALSARERELINTKRESLERQLFGLSSANSSDPHQLIAYRDAHDRATNLPDSTAAAELLASATRSGDRTLAAAITARALALVEPPGVLVSNGWRTVINDYAKQFPSEGETLADLLNLRNRQTMGAVFAYMPPF